MPKLKNSKTAAKRIKKVTRNGKVLRRKMSAQHRMHGKNKKIRQRSKQGKTLTKGDFRKIKKLVPNKI